MIKLTSLLKENNFDKAPDAIYADRSVKAFNQGKSKTKDYSASDSTAGLKYLSKLVGKSANDIKSWIDKMNTTREITSKGGNSIGVEDFVVTLEPFSGYTLKERKRLASLIKTSMNGNKKTMRELNKWLKVHYYR
tara:strand:+ start:207 stop:611 length:405 start_codon:yes stop_codon:yes gene_type:complete